jgi:hypothetical protein
VVCNRDGMGDAGGGDGGLRKGGGLVVEVRGATESRAGPFIGAGRSVRGDILSFAELQWPATEVRENPGVDSGRRDSWSIGCCVG